MVEYDERLRKTIGKVETIESSHNVNDSSRQCGKAMWKSEKEKLNDGTRMINQSGRMKECVGQLANPARSNKTRYARLVEVNWNDGVCLTWCRSVEGGVWGIKVKDGGSEVERGGKCASENHAPKVASQKVKRCLISCFRGRETASSSYKF